MRQLILIKHAAPLVIPGTAPEKWTLSDKGRESCDALADALREYQLSAIVSSTEPKAIETAEVTASRLSVPATTSPDLHEHDRSNVPHMRSGEFISHMELFFRKPAERVLGKESADQATDRFDRAVAAVLSQHPSGNIAIVSHGTVIALYLARHANQDPFACWRRMGLPSFALLSLPQLKLLKIVDRIDTDARKR
jgi:broad specificity phosphatase PhoE